MNQTRRRDRRLAAAWLYGSMPGSRWPDATPLCDSCLSQSGRRRAKRGPRDRMCVAFPMVDGQRDFVRLDSPSPRQPLRCGRGTRSIAGTPPGTTEMSGPAGGETQAGRLGSVGRQAGQTGRARPPKSKMRARMSNAAQATFGSAVRAWRAQQGIKAVRPAPLTPGLERCKRNHAAARGRGGSSPNEA